MLPGVADLCQPMSHIHLKPHEGRTQMHFDLANVLSMGGAPPWFITALTGSQGLSFPKYLRGCDLLETVGIVDCCLELLIPGFDFIKLPA